ncbi:hypothetical protein GHT06_012793 [Daphnia sinensis]|uniref:Uncharacterized protein n=1 Tax=Daphnia sinensis TaxID=1820382 RepID=A0AAD5KWI1_9CRUS|nr:hypothetical protein GHT06_012793 [Daphnia sinensis]
MLNKNKIHLHKKKIDGRIQHRITVWGIFKKSHAYRHFVQTSCGRRERERKKKEFASGVCVCVP